MIVEFLSQSLGNLAVDISMIAGMVSVIVGIFFLLFLLVTGMSKMIDASKYCYAFVKWFFFIKTKENFDQEQEMMFLSPKNFQMVQRMQTFVNDLGEEHLKIMTCRYSDLKHPLFMWHNKIFCRTNGNDIVCLEDGILGKIPMNEIVQTVKIFSSLLHVASILETHRAMQEKFKKMGWYYDNGEQPVEVTETTSS